MTMRNKKEIAALNAKSHVCPDVDAVQNWERHVQNVADVVKDNFDSCMAAVTVEFCEFDREWKIDCSGSLSVSPGVNIALKLSASLSETALVEELINASRGLGTQFAERCRLLIAATRQDDWQTI